MKTIKWIIFPLIVIFLVLGYIYPYSNISFYKTTKYNPDQIIVQEYLQLLNNFKDVEKNDETSVTTKKIINELHTQWLINNKSTSVSKKEINRQIQHLQKIYDNLMQLQTNNSMNYRNNTMDFLIILIEDTGALKNQLQEISDSNFTNRKELQNELSNVHMVYFQYLKKTISFYESYKLND